MKNDKKAFIYVFLAFFIEFLNPFDGKSQVVYSSPWFFGGSDSVTVFFDANRGNGGLSGFNGPVYAHTGVITNVSNQWRYVKAAWGTADPSVQMTSLGNGLYRISFRPRTYYGVPSGETIRKLAFVFRNSDGSVTGRNADGSDIFLDLADSTKINCAITLPIIETGTPVPSVTTGQTLSLNGIADSVCQLKFTLDGAAFDSTTDDSLATSVVASGFGVHTIRLIAEGTGSSDTSSFQFLINPVSQTAALPQGSKDGVTYLNDSTVRFNLFAPQKQFVYVLGDFNNWQLDTGFLMRRTPDSTRYWLEVTGLIPGREYVYQYFVDGAIKIADPYAEKILDPSNDNGIGAATYPNPTPYPTGRTTGVASVLQTARPSYVWHTTNYTRPAKTDLVIYELLLRDFRSAHNYQSIIDTLPYLQRLGINAIELMPVNEFNGNQSWGYNPSFYFAPDKYYGTRESLKAFIDSCHARGIAVILDMVFNHQDLPSPMVQLYYNSGAGRPASNSPWFNMSAPHDFSVFFDMNHDSPHTRYFIDRVNEFWLTEYKVDGFRYDLAKGFTQRYTLGNTSLFAAYDSTRVFNIERMADHVWTVDSTAYVILELFADNSEETRYANDGMMLWGNSNYSYNQATMGFQSGSDFGSVSYKSRNWSVPHLIGYMESHDEERLMYKNIMYGAVSGNYSVKDTSTALRRMELAGAFYFTIPGPKMIWMGGELGYDVSINNPCRTCNRPFRWNYTAVPGRQRVYEVWSTLINLRKSEPAFRTSNFNMQLSSLSKTIHLNHASMNVTVMGNFGVTTANVNPVFQQTGWWYEYFTGDSINVTNVLSPISMQPGEYRLYTSRRLNVPAMFNSTEDVMTSDNIAGFTAYPNPVTDEFTLSYVLKSASRVRLDVFSLTGQKITTLSDEFRPEGLHETRWNSLAAGLSAGCYVVQLTTENGNAQLRLIVR
jgi:1,4-alpha-glucan branching enzyme